jgi:hypothetical protein
MSGQVPRPVTDPEPTQRQPYERPDLEFIELHGDQVLSNSCKTAVSSGQGEWPCGSTGCSSTGTS